MLKTLLGMDSKVIPLQLLQLVKSPDFGILVMLPSDQLLGITAFSHILWNTGCKVSAARTNICPQKHLRGNSAMSEWQRKLLVNFVDFEKAFDSLHRDSLWENLRNYGIPSKVVQLIKQFYTNFSCTINFPFYKYHWKSLCV
jgi:hypothetical protein